jgi:RNA polymerase sigma-70 factor (ECF subfamily)
MGEGAGVASSKALDERVRRLIGAGRSADAATEALRALGPQVLGYLSGVMGSEADADDVFASSSERVWRSLPKFEWRCSLRTWFYMVAHREIARFRQRAKRHIDGRVGISELQSVLGAVRSSVSSAQGSERQQKLAKLRAELPEQDRALLVLRVDRDMPWEEIALVVAEGADGEGEGAEGWSEEDTKREAARLRKRFQIVRERLATRVREEKLELGTPRG